MDEQNHPEPGTERVPGEPPSTPSPQAWSRRPSWGGIDWLTVLVVVAALANGAFYLYGRTRAPAPAGPAPVRGASIPAGLSAPSEGFQAPPGSGRPAPPPGTGAPPPPPQSPASAPPAGRPGRSILDP